MMQITNVCKLICKTNMRNKHFTIYITKASYWESKTVADIISEIYDALRTQVGVYYIRATQFRS